MTLDELKTSKPRGEQVIECPDDSGVSGVWKVFICHGCQSCWYVGEDDSAGEHYPHFLSIERISK